MRFRNPAVVRHPRRRALAALGMKSHDKIPAEFTPNPATGSG
jgi:hypothetical protein